MDTRQAKSILKDVYDKAAHLVGAYDIECHLLDQYDQGRQEDQWTHHQTRTPRGKIQIYADDKTLIINQHQKLNILMTVLINILKLPLTWTKHNNSDLVNDMFQFL